MDRFNELKEEIIRRCKEKSACEYEFKKVLKSETTAELLTVIKNNFSWSCENILDSEFIDKYKSEFNENNIFCNESRDSGYLLVCGGTIANVRGGTIANVWGGTIDNVCGGTIANVRGGTIANVCGGTIANVRGNAYITSYNLFECKLHDNAIYRVRETNTIYYASNEIKFVKQDTNLD